MSDAATRAWIRECDSMDLVREARMGARLAREDAQRAAYGAVDVRDIDDRCAARVHAESAGDIAEFIGLSHARYVAALVCLLEWWRLEREAENA